MRTRALVLIALFAATALHAENITVATINVWSGLEYRGAFVSREYEDRATRAFRFDLLADGLSGLDLDAVAVQEANPLPRYAEDLGSLMGFDAISDVRQGGVRVGTVGLPANLREGEALLAPPERQLTLSAVKQLAGPAAGNVASFQFGTGSQILAGTIVVEDRTVHLFSTRWTPSPQADRTRLVQLVDHYLAGEIDAADLSRRTSEAIAGSERRIREAEETVVFINELAGEEPVILMGSLYSLPDSEEIQILRDAGFVDVWSVVGRGTGVTYDSALNGNIIDHGLGSFEGERVRYDYIFIRGSGIFARSASIIFAQPTYGVHASDHFGIVAQLRVDPE